MPIIDLKNASCNYILEGNGQDTIVFAHGLLWSHWMFHNQVAFLKSNYRILAYDFRGQGGTTAKNGKYDLAKEIALNCNYPSQPIGKIIHYLADRNPIQAKNFMEVLPGSFSVFSSLKMLRYYDSKGESNSSINLLESIIRQYLLMEHT